MIEKIISGGQTGADQAALDAAIKLGIPHGGWISIGFVNHQQLGRPSENSITKWAFQLLFRYWHHILAFTLSHQGSAAQYMPDSYQGQYWIVYGPVNGTIQKDW